MKRTLEDYNRSKWHKWGKNELICYDNEKPLRNYKYLEDTDFVKPNTDCTTCDTNSDTSYVCFDCEADQIREKYPKVRYTDDCEWVLPKLKKRNGDRTQATPSNLSVRD